MRDIRIALNICTYKRIEFIRKNVDKLMLSKFFNEADNPYYGRLHIFVVDNAAEMEPFNCDDVHVIYNRNTGGSGGFQRGLEAIRAAECKYSHVIFMDDDVEFELESFYILYDFLVTANGENADRPVAGRMFCMDKRAVQYTAAEIWNGGAIDHLEYMRRITEDNYHPGKVIYDSGADYGGWWLCCFPMSFCRDNDILPFFLHCDDVEYGLRCGKSPIIIEGFQVWHEIFDKRDTPLIHYYDTRNPLFVNEIYSLGDKPENVLAEWKKSITEYHVKNDLDTEYFIIRGMNDFLKGMDWLKGIDSETYHQKLTRMKGGRIRNAIFWRLVERRFRKKYNC